MKKGKVTRARNNARVPSKIKPSVKTMSAHADRMKPANGICVRAPTATASGREF